MTKKENTLSETVAKLKCGSYMWGAKEEAVCNSALACVNKKKGKKRETKAIWAYISTVFVIFFVYFGKRILYPG